jgi:hypothetical protein
MPNKIALIVIATLMLLTRTLSVNGQSFTDKLHSHILATEQEIVRHRQSIERWQAIIAQNELRQHIINQQARHSQRNTISLTHRHQRWQLNQNNLRLQRNIKRSLTIIKNLQNNLVRYHNQLIFMM